MSYDLRIERLLDGTPDEIFNAFTEEDAMLEWYQDGPEWNVEVLACDPRVGGTTTVAFGPGDVRYKEVMTYTEVNRPNKVAYDEDFVTPDGESFLTNITVTFEAQNGKTLLTIVQTGFPNAEQRDAHQGGWPGFIDRLEKVVITEESIVSYEFRLERVFDASPGEVFDAITDPAAQREWWSPDGPVDAECDLRVGGSAFVEWTTEGGHRCRAEQTYVEVDRPRKLVFTEVVIEPDAPTYECTLVMTFEDQNGKTLFTLHHTGFPTAEERDKHEGGTKIFTGRLDEYLARARR